MDVLFLSVYILTNICIALGGMTPKTVIISSETSRWIHQSDTAQGETTIEHTPSSIFSTSAVDTDSSSTLSSSSLSSSSLSATSPTSSYQILPSKTTTYQRQSSFVDSSPVFQSSEEKAKYKLKTSIIDSSSVFQSSEETTNYELTTSTVKSSQVFQSSEENVSYELKTSTIDSSSVFQSSEETTKHDDLQTSTVDSSQTLQSSFSYYDDTTGNEQKISISEEMTRYQQEMSSVDSSNVFQSAFSENQYISKHEHESSNIDKSTVSQNTFKTNVKSPTYSNEDSTIYDATVVKSSFSNFEKSIVSSSNHSFQLSANSLTTGAPSNSSNSDLVNDSKSTLVGDTSGLWLQTSPSSQLYVDTSMYGTSSDKPFENNSTLERSQDQSNSEIPTITSYSNNPSSDLSRSSHFSLSDGSDSSGDLNTEYHNSAPSTEGIATKSSTVSKSSSISGIEILMASNFSASEIAHWFESGNDLTQSVSSDSDNWDELTAEPTSDLKSQNVFSPSKDVSSIETKQSEYVVVEDEASHQTSESLISPSDTYSKTESEPTDYVTFEDETFNNYENIPSIDTFRGSSATSQAEASEVKGTSYKVEDSSQPEILASSTATETSSMDDINMEYSRIKALTYPSFPKETASSISSETTPSLASLMHGSDISTESIPVETSTSIRRTSMFDYEEITETTYRILSIPELLRLHQISQQSMTATESQFLEPTLTSDSGHLPLKTEIEDSLLNPDDTISSSGQQFYGSSYLKQDWSYFETAESELFNSELRSSATEHDDISAEVQSSRDSSHATDELSESVFPSIGLSTLTTGTSESHSENGGTSHADSQFKSTTVHIGPMTSTNVRSESSNYDTIQSLSIPALQPPSISINVRTKSSRRNTNSMNITSSASQRSSNSNADIGDTPFYSSVQSSVSSNVATDVSKEENTSPINWSSSDERSISLPTMGSRDSTQTFARESMFPTETSIERVSTDGPPTINEDVPSTTDYSLKTNTRINSGTVSLRHDLSLATNHKNSVSPSSDLHLSTDQTFPSDIAQRRTTDPVPTMTTSSSLQTDALDESNDLDRTSQPSATDTMFVQDSTPSVSATDSEFIDTRAPLPSLDLDQNEFSISDDDYSDSEISMGPVQTVRETGDLVKGYSSLSSPSLYTMIPSALRKHSLMTGHTATTLLPGVQVTEGTFQESAGHTSIVSEPSMLEASSATGTSSLHQASASLDSALSESTSNIRSRSRVLLRTVTETSQPVTFTESSSSPMVDEYPVTETLESTSREAFTSIVLKSTETPIDSQVSTIESTMTSLESLTTAGSSSIDSKGTEIQGTVYYTTQTEPIFGSRRSQTLSVITPSESSLYFDNSSRPSTISVESSTLALSSISRTDLSSAVTPTTSTAPTATSYTSSPIATSYTSYTIATSYTSSPIATSYNSSPIATNYNSSPIDTSYTSSPIATSYTSSPKSTSYTSSPIDTSYTSSPIAPSYTSSTIATSYTSSTIATSYTSSTIAPSYTSSTISTSYTSSTIAPSYTSSTIAPSYTSSTIATSYTSSTIARRYTSADKVTPSATTSTATVTATTLTPDEEEDSISSDYILKWVFTTPDGVDTTTADFIATIIKGLKTTYEIGYSRQHVRGKRSVNGIDVTVHKTRTLDDGRVEMQFSVSRDGNLVQASEASVTFSQVSAEELEENTGVQTFGDLGIAPLQTVLSSKPEFTDNMNHLIHTGATVKSSRAGEQKQGGITVSGSTETRKSSEETSFKEPLQTQNIASETTIMKTISMTTGEQQIYSTSALSSRTLSTEGLSEDLSSDSVSDMARSTNVFKRTNLFTGPSMKLSTTPIHETSSYESDRPTQTIDVSSNYITASSPASVDQRSSIYVTGSLTPEMLSISTSYTESFMVKPSRLDTSSFDASFDSTFKPSVILSSPLNSRFSFSARVSDLRTRLQTMSDTVISTINSNQILSSSENILESPSTESEVQRSSNYITEMLSPSTGSTESTGVMSYPLETSMYPEMTYKSPLTTSSPFDSRFTPSPLPSNLRTRLQTASLSDTVTTIISSSQLPSSLEDIFESPSSDSSYLFTRTRTSRLPISTTSLGPLDLTSSVMSDQPEISSPSDMVDDYSSFSLRDGFSDVLSSGYPSHLSSNYLSASDIRSSDSLHSTLDPSSVDIIMNMLSSAMSFNPETNNSDINTSYDQVVTSDSYNPLSNPASVTVMPIPNITLTSAMDRHSETRFLQSVGMDSVTVNSDVSYQTEWFRTRVATLEPTIAISGSGMSQEQTPSISETVASELMTSMPEVSGTVSDVTDLMSQGNIKSPSASLDDYSFSGTDHLSSALDRIPSSAEVATRTTEYSVEPSSVSYVNSELPSTPQQRASISSYSEILTSSSSSFVGKQQSSSSLDQVLFTSLPSVYPNKISISLREYDTSLYSRLSSPDAIFISDSTVSDQMESSHSTTLPLLVNSTVMSSMPSSGLPDTSFMNSVLRELTTSIPSYTTVASANDTLQSSEIETNLRSFQTIPSALETQTTSGPTFTDIVSESQHDTIVSSPSSPLQLTPLDTYAVQDTPFPSYTESASSYTVTSYTISTQANTETKTASTDSYPESTNLSSLLSSYPKVLGTQYTVMSEAESYVPNTAVPSYMETWLQSTQPTAMTFITESSSTSVQTSFINTKEEMSSRFMLDTNAMSSSDILPPSVRVTLSTETVSTSTPEGSTDASLIIRISPSASGTVFLSESTMLTPTQIISVYPSKSVTLSSSEDTTYSPTNSVTDSTSLSDAVSPKLTTTISSSMGATYPSQIVKESTSVSDIVSPTLTTSLSKGTTYPPTKSATESTSVSDTVSPTITATMSSSKEVTPSATQSTSDPGTPAAPTTPATPAGPTTPATPAGPPESALMLLTMNIGLGVNISSPAFIQQLESDLTQLFQIALTERTKRDLHRHRRQENNVNAEVLKSERDAETGEQVTTTFAVQEEGGYVEADLAVPVFNRISQEQTSIILSQQVLGPIRAAVDTPPASRPSTNLLILVAVLIPAVLLLVGVLFIIVQARRRKMRANAVGDLPPRYQRGETLEDHNLTVDVEKGEVVDKTPTSTPSLHPRASHTERKVPLMGGVCAPGLGDSDEDGDKTLYPEDVALVEGERGSHRSLILKEKELLETLGIHDVLKTPSETSDDLTLEIPKRSKSKKLKSGGASEYSTVGSECPLIPSSASMTTVSSIDSDVHTDASDEFTVIIRNQSPEMKEKRPKMSSPERVKSNDVRQSRAALPSPDVQSSVSDVKSSSTVSPTSDTTSPTSDQVSSSDLQTTSPSIQPSSGSTLASTPSTQASSPSTQASSPLSQSSTGVQTSELITPHLPLTSTGVQASALGKHLPLTSVGVQASSTSSSTETRSVDTQTSKDSSVTSASDLSSPDEKIESLPGVSGKGQPDTESKMVQTPWRPKRRTDPRDIYIDDDDLQNPNSPVNTRLSISAGPGETSHFLFPVPESITQAYNRAMKKGKKDDSSSRSSERLTDPDSPSISSLDSDSDPSLGSGRLSLEEDTLEDMLGPLQMAQQSEVTASWSRKNSGQSYKYSIGDEDETPRFMQMFPNQNIVPSRGPVPQSVHPRHPVPQPRPRSSLTRRGAMAAQIEEEAIAEEEEAVRRTEDTTKRAKELLQQTHALAAPDLQSLSPSDMMERIREELKRSELPVPGSKGVNIPKGERKSPSSKSVTSGSICSGSSGDSGGASTDNTAALLERVRGELQRIDSKDAVKPPKPPRKKGKHPKS